MTLDYNLKQELGKPASSDPVFISSKLIPIAVVKQDKVYIPKNGDNM